MRSQTHIIILILFGSILQAQVQMEVEGKFKVSVMDEAINADSVVVWLPDSTLARRAGTTFNNSGWIMNIDTTFTLKHVGIGTSFPTELLHIRSEGDAALRLEADSNDQGEANNPRVYLTQDGGTTEGVLGITGNPNIDFTGSLANTTFLGSNSGANDAIQFVTGQMARMTIKNNGDIGLGTNTPTERLHVIGKTIVSNMDTITSAQDTTSGNVVRLSNGTLALRKYKVGDIAQGGIIFWVDETGEHGLVSSQNDLESSSPGDFLHQWSTTLDVTGATGGTVVDSSFNGKGAGAMNTMLIVSADRDDTDSAARLCSDLIEGGYGDWYLPSKGELHLMYTNLHLAGLGGFGNFYWSSTEIDANSAFIQNFDTGLQGLNSKNGLDRVRAIRIF